LSAKLSRLDSLWIPENFDYGSVSGLSNEVKEKLRRSLPSTLGQASRISGVTPAAVTLLMTVIEKRANKLTEQA
jgi:tRNA uridine 5-carboxymethylaminomethyl modification enzyme